jgi:5'-nucleotidase / UDP-sugar diphosphatase
MFMKTAVYALALWYWLLVAGWAFGKELPLTILYTNTTNGVWQGCSCPRGGDGGLGRRMAIIKREQAKEHNILLIDSGDMFSVMPDSNKDRYFLEIMKRMKFTFLNLGNQEFVNGVDFVRHYIEEGELPFYSASLKYVDPVKNAMYPLAPPYLITEVDGRKVGIIGVTNNDAFKFLPAKAKQNLVVVDAEEVLPGILSNLKKEKVGIIIVVSHCGYEADKKLAEKFPDIEVIIGGHSQTLLEKPEKVGSTLIVQAGEEGGRLGELKMVFNESGQILLDQGELFRLSRDVTGDPQIEEMLKQYQDSLMKNKFWK